MKTIQELKAQGHIKPLPLATFEVGEIDKAFLTFSKGTHIGKLLISYDDSSDKGITVRQISSNLSRSSSSGDQLWASTYMRTGTTGPLHRQV